MSIKRSTYFDLKNKFEEKVKECETLQAQLHESQGAFHGLFEDYLCVTHRMDKAETDKAALQKENQDLKAEILALKTAGKTYAGY
jgi:predicted nuclease with TOPRIM domain